MSRIGWPADEPLMWVQALPEYESGFLVDAPFAGEHLVGIPFARWHAALVDAMHWAYTPDSKPPRGWVAL